MPSDTSCYFLRQRGDCLGGNVYRTIQCPSLRAKCLRVNGHERSRSPDPVSRWCRRVQPWFTDCDIFVPPCHISDVQFNAQRSSVFQWRHRSSNHDWSTLPRHNHHFIIASEEWFNQRMARMFLPGP